jgi:hypothetical protein
MERFYFDAGVVSVFVGREEASDLGVRASGENIELWLGKSYVCATYDAARLVRASSIASMVLVAFVVGWFLDPPSSLRGQPETACSLQETWPAVAAKFDRKI